VRRRRRGNPRLLEISWKCRKGSDTFREWNKMKYKIKKELSFAWPEKRTDAYQRERRGKRWASSYGEMQVSVRTTWGGPS